MLCQEGYLLRFQATNRPHGAVAKLRELQKAGGDGYIVRADRFYSSGRRDENPVCHIGEVAVMTRPPSDGPGRPRTAAVYAELEAMGVKVLLAEHSAVRGMHITPGHPISRFLRSRFPELRRFDRGFLMLDGSERLSTLLHEASHARDRIDILPRFKEEIKRLGARLETAQAMALWTYLTEQRAYTAEYLQLAEEGRLAPESRYDLSHNGRNSRELMGGYRKQLAGTMAGLPEDLRREVRKLLGGLMRPELLRLPEFSLPR